MVKPRPRITLEDALGALDQMIGLDPVKEGYVGCKTFDQMAGELKAWQR